MGIVVYVGGGLYMYIGSSVWLSLFGSHEHCLSVCFAFFPIHSYINSFSLPSFSFVLSSFLSFTLSLCLVSFSLGFNSRAYLIGFLIHLIVLAFWGDSTN